MGDLMGAWVWSEIGHCAMAAGEYDMAEELFHLALDRRTVPMYMSRPDALSGMCDIAIERGNLDEARDWLGQLREFVRARNMRSAEVTLLMTEGKLAAANGNHADALARFDGALAHLEGDGFVRTELDIHASRVRALRALGDTDGERTAMNRFEEVVGIIASRIDDDRLRTAFSEGTVDMVGTG